MENVESLLQEILAELQLLTVQTKVVAIPKFDKEFLSTPLRREMYEALDGMRTLPEISHDISCKQNTLQIFAQQLIDNNLVDYYMKGNARVLSKSLAKIALYYANKELEEAQNG